MGRASRVLMVIALLAPVTALVWSADDSATADPSPWPAINPSAVDPPAPTPLLYSDEELVESRVDYGSVIDTHGWPVPMPYRYYPQGVVTDDGVGIYQCLVPPDPLEACFCTPPPCYFGMFYVEGIALDRRSNLERMGLFFDSVGTEVLNTADFDLETEAGFRLGVWAFDPCGIDWNIDYFSVRNFQSTLTQTDAAGLTNVFFGFTDTPVTSLTAEYESNLDSLEFTVRTRQWRRIAPLVGIRFIQVDEHFNSLQDVTARTGSFSQSDNELFGLQFGLQGLLYEASWWRLETTLKAGPYYNDIDVNATVTPSGGTAISRRLDQNALSFAGDARIGLVCQLGPRINFRIGYQALWLEGVALGPNQNNDISLTTNINSIDLSGVLYQGGDIGFDLTW